MTIRSLAAQRFAPAVAILLTLPLPSSAQFPEMLEGKIVSLSGWQVPEHFPAEYFFFLCFPLFGARGSARTEVVPW